MAQEANKDAVITPEMVGAGVERLLELLEAGTSSAYVVEEVFRAMAMAAPQAGPQASPST